VLVSRRENTRVALPEADDPSSSQDGRTGIEGAALGNHSLEYENLELDTFVSAFADLRSKFRKQAAKNESRRGMNNARENAGVEASRSMPPRHLNRDLWFKYCFGSAAEEEGSEGQTKEEVAGFKPLLSVLESMSQPKVRWLLQRVVEFVLKRETCVVSEQESLWVFALSVMINKPLDDDTSASYRSLVKFCLGFLKTNRHENPKEQIDRDLKQEAKEDESNESNANRLKLLLAISGAYFGQVEVLSQCFANHLRL
jgi:hypothetical protein